MLFRSGSRNKQNVVLATIEGLRQLKTPEEVARLRGKSVDREKLQKQIAALENKIRKEKQFNRQVEMNVELKQLRRNLENML